MALLKELIKSVEDHTGEIFDLSKKRHFGLLNNKIERLNENELRKLKLITEVLKSEKNENSIYNDGVQYLRNRHS